MKIGILSLCFFRHNEIKESLNSIYNSLIDSNNIKLCLVHLPSPKSNEVIQEIKNSDFKNKFLINYSVNHVSSSLLSASLETDIFNDCEFIAVTETDIRIVTKGCIEKCCEVLIKHPEICYVSPEYDTTDNYHRYAVNDAGWIPQLYPYQNNIMRTSSRGYQLLVWRKNDWIEFCKDVKNGMFINNKEKSYGIMDGNSSIWAYNKKKSIIAVLKDNLIIHSGWDVYKTPTVDQEYLDYKNNLIKENNIWSLNNTKGNETYDFTVTKI